jgi:hypothetical protein
MNRLMAENSKLKRTTIADLMVTPQPLGFETHSSVRYLEPLPTDLKQATVGEFRAYLDAQRRAAAQKASGANRAAGPKASRQAGGEAADGTWAALFRSLPLSTQRAIRKESSAELRGARMRKPAKRVRTASV